MGWDIHLVMGLASGLVGTCMVCHGKTGIVVHRGIWLMYLSV